MSTQVIFQIQSALIVLLMIYGVTQAKNRPRHVKVMSTAMIWDVVWLIWLHYIDLEPDMWRDGLLSYIEQYEALTLDELLH